MEIIDFALTSDYIELIKLLKLLNLVETGGEAKEVVSDKKVRCNKIIETRKRKKLRAGDEIQFEGYLIKIH